MVCSPTWLLRTGLSHFPLVNCGDGSGDLLISVGNIRYEVWLQNQDKFVTIVLIYRVNKIHIGRGEAEARYEFY